MRKNLFSYLVVLLLIIGLIAGCGQAKNSESNESNKPSASNQNSAKKIVVGGIFTQEGKAAQFGIEALKGAQLAVKEINAKGGINGLPVELSVTDDKADIATASAQMQKLAGNKDISAVLYAPITSIVIALSNNAKQLGIPVISMGSAGVVKFNEWNWRFSQTDEKAVPSLIENIKEKYNMKTEGIIYASNDDWASSIADVNVKEAEKQGIKVVAKESFQTGDVDFRAQITKIVEANPDILVVLAHEDELSLMIPLARKMGLKSKFVGFGTFQSEAVLKIAGKEMEGSLTAVSFDPDSTRPETKGFVEAYKKEYPGEVPAPNSAHGYDAMMFLAQGLSEIENPNDRTALRDALASISDFKGSTADLKFSGQGDASRDIYLVESRDGKFLPLR